ncbi:hypothetical protein LXL04_031600 [Taraxacum kok-saghyz]
MNFRCRFPVSISTVSSLRIAEIKRMERMIRQTSLLTFQARKKIGLPLNGFKIQQSIIGSFFVEMLFSLLPSSISNPKRRLLTQNRVCVMASRPPMVIWILETSL